MENMDHATSAGAKPAAKTGLLRNLIVLPMRAGSCATGFHFHIGY